MKPYFAESIKPINIGITKYQNGLLLYDLKNKNSKNSELLISLADLFALPYSVYLLDVNGATVKINEEGATICGFNSSSHAIGKTIFAVSMASAKQLLDNCESTLKQESVKIFDEFNTRLDGKSLQFLSFKFPCYNFVYQLQGTLGISIVLGEHSLANAITQLTDIGLLPKNNSEDSQALKLNLGNVLLTPREQECLEFTVKGFTAKQIAKKLAISPRTVEEYINHVKLKLETCTKREMIQKVLDIS
ncbi:LuxR family transcriptional regulator [Legionella busanensis]|uniref:LuxR family transcriptional regulator n=1 Tax=Legionella busanensis TaxID=190655 RepID=A0A378JMZ9_9GAMM|nr:helix-turn-helix transcriptional regulator [Legionella busanensis]STX51569.1 LuxR family transcriptional regulator [Legionella busanensis]